MRYLHATHKARMGETIEVTLSQPAKVLLMTPREYKRYAASISFRYRGGHFEDSPVNLRIPKDGTWHLIIELGSYHNPEPIQASSRIMGRDVSTTNSSPNAVDAVEAPAEDESIAVTSEEYAEEATDELVQDAEFSDEEETSH